MFFGALASVQLRSRRTQSVSGRMVVAVTQGDLCRSSIGLKISGIQYVGLEISQQNKSLRGMRSAVRTTCNQCLLVSITTS